MNRIKEIYKYREMLKNLVKKDLRTRYKGSFLGFLWTFVNPLLMLGVYSILFKIIVRAQIENYAIFLFVALLPWIFTQTSIQISATTIITNSNLVKKVYFPREILPISVVLGALVNFLFSVAIILPVLFFLGKFPGMKLMHFPLILLIQLIFNTGIALIVSSLNVYFRDLEHIVGILMMAWFYLTPVLYPIDIVPKSFIKIFKLNPMTPIVLAYRDILFFNQIPDYNLFRYIIIVSIFILISGMYIFMKLERSFAEDI
jgi:ABC-2 type transport system permease protein